MGSLVGINDGMYKKDSARFRGHSRCSINVNTFRAAEVMIMVMMMIGKEVSQLQGVWGVSSCCPTPRAPLGRRAGPGSLLVGAGVEVSDWNPSWVCSQLLCFINTSLVVFSSSCWGMCSGKFQGPPPQPRARCSTLLGLCSDPCGQGFMWESGGRWPRGCLCPLPVSWGPGQGV